MIRLTTIICALILVLFLISFLLKNSSASPEKKSSFECGFDPNHEIRESFSMRFFLLTVIFLLFDLEITFILALPFNMKNEGVAPLNITHGCIFLLFLWSTYLEWKMGALDWFWFDI